MTFTPDQIAALDAKLEAGVVKSREQAGRKLSYIEGWHAIAEANRIFGFDGWTRETIDLRQVHEPYQNDKSNWVVGYAAKVRITVGGVIRDGSGFGSGIDRDLGRAHESALKEAETDAMKRALMTFGNPFGLALYDKTQENVERDPPRRHEPPQRPVEAPRAQQTSTTPNTAHTTASVALAEKMGAAIRRCGSIDAIEAVREDPNFRRDFNSLPAALAATVGEVIKTMRAQFERAA